MNDRLLKYFMVSSLKICYTTKLFLINFHIDDKIKINLISTGIVIIYFGINCYFNDKSNTFFFFFFIEKTWYLQYYIKTYK